MGIKQKNPPCEGGKRDVPLALFIARPSKHPPRPLHKGEEVLFKLTIPPIHSPIRGR